MTTIPDLRSMYYIHHNNDGTTWYIEELYKLDGVELSEPAVVVKTVDDRTGDLVGLRVFTNKVQALSECIRDSVIINKELL